MGNHQIRGVSGGETRRTSIAEALMSNAQFQCWDNSTRGLDSSTAQQFIELLRKSTRTLLSTTVMSIYQASEAMYKGRQVYFVPSNSAVDYFHDLGFEKPPRATTADFLTSLTNPAERIIRDGYHDRAPKSPDEFADAWKDSPQAKHSLGSLSRTMEQTMAPASIVVLLCIVYTGFVIPVPYMKPWLSWFRRLNPMAYAYESLMINEFSNREFACPSTIPAGPGYSDQPQMDGKVCPVVGAEPGVPNVQGPSYLLLKYWYELNHLWRNFGIIIAMIIAMMIIFCATHLLAAEYIPAERSKGDVLLFQRGHTKVGRKGSSTTPEDARALPAFAQDTNLLQSGYYRAGRSSEGVSSELKHSSVFHWDGLSYELKTRHGTKRILSNIDGWVEPGLNIEQRKRLSIGIELVAKPELLLFLDEPTSGLDSQTAWSICMLLRKLASHGQAVLCTIHQPSPQLFQMLDNTRIRCSAVQLLHIDIPRGSPATTTCGSYLGPFLRYAGGYVENPEATATERCLYCPVDRTNHLLLRFGIHAEQSAWQNVGYMSVYVVFNVLATYLIYWLARVPKRTGRERT
ncbi:hypothetical protein PG996_010910 [Apiospora saccharicola]|uniref:ABC transporter domain-containing protein n=1 Tax=Apiospora saccharicola TaxID=335842 RepID=A0ABR1USF7_9PEZI